MRNHLYYLDICFWLLDRISKYTLFGIGRLNMFVSYGLHKRHSSIICA